MDINTNLTMRSIPHRDTADLKPATVFNLPKRQELADAGQMHPPVEDSGPADIAQEQVSSAVSQLNDYVQNVQRSLQFTVDQDTGRTVIRVIDAETDEVIRQMPPEEVLALVRHFTQPDAQTDPQGLFLKEKA